MTITDQIKILNRKVMQNEAQDDLDRKAAKISALYSNNLDQYDYLIAEDLGLKPSTVEQAKFEYYSLGKIFNKTMDKDDKKEELFKRLRNIENAQNINTKLRNVFNYLKSLSQKAKDLIDEIEDANDDIDDGKLLFIGSNKERFNFNTFNKPLNFISAIYNSEILLKEADIKQRVLDKKIQNLRGYKNNAEEEEKEQTNELLMHADNMLKYGDKLLRHLEMYFFV